MLKFDVTKRIKDLCNAYSWTYYRLAKESDITYSTLSAMLNKGTIPSIPTLEKICKGFNISLSQFFAEDESVALMTFPQKEYLARWETLTQENRMCVDKFIDFLKAKHSETDR